MTLTDVHAVAPRELAVSYAQQRLWLVDRLQPGGAASTIALVADLTGPVNPAALTASFAAVVRRHDALRTSFRVRGGHPRQVVHERLEPVLSLVDLRGLSSPAQTQAVERALRAIADTPFALERPPLWSLSLISLTAETHVIALAVHHIIFDQGSEAIVVRELTQAYDAAIRGVPCSLAPPAVQYPAVAAAQRARLEGPAIEPLLTFWRGQIGDGDAPGASALPFRRGSDAARGGAGRTAMTTIAGNPYDALRTLARTQGTSLFTVTLAAFFVVLHRYARGGTMRVAVPVSSRDRPGFDEVVGLMVNLVPVCVAIDDRERFLALLARVAGAVLAAFEHQDLPFDKLVELLEPERYYGGTRLTQVVFAYRRMRRATFEAGGLRITPRDVTRVHATFELSVMLVEHEDGLEVAIEYDTARFDDTDVERLLQNYRTLLTRLPRVAEGPLRAVPLPCRADEALQLEAWNGAGDLDAAWDGGVVRGIARRVRQQPDAVAVHCGDDCLTYAALARRSHGVAAWLRAEGAGPETLVGVAVTRSIPTVVTLLGVLQSGAAYVALDADAPAARLQTLAREAGVSRVLASATHVPRLRAALAGQCEVVDVETIGLREPRAIAWPPIEPDALAYVLFTSGSTGEPKGVMISHRNLAASTAARPAYYGTSAPRFLVLSPFFFDSSVAGLFWTLTSGGCLALPEEEAVRDPERLAQDCVEQGITHLLCIPALYRGLLDAWRSDAGPVQVAIVAGEACAADVVRTHRDTLKTVRLYNEYGPTEATVWCAVCRLDTDAGRTHGDGDDRVPIGRAVDTQRVYVVDARGQLMPSGARGEILAGGSGVARGYWRQPAWTAETFVPDAFTRGRGRRAYRTGDRARWRSDGQLLFDGRFDDEVKIRGHRLSLGEVESLLRQHPDVTAAAAVVVERPGGSHVRASVVVRAQAEVTGDALRAMLRQRLPSAVVPPVVRLLPALPTLATGKLDRGRLREMLERDDGALAEQEAVLDPIERVIADIWTDVLGREAIGAEDNFFEIGGHSLLATQVLGRLKAAIDRAVPLRALFEQPTLRAFADRVRRAHLSDALGTDAPSIRPRAARERVPLAFQQQRLWYLYEADRASVDYHLPRAVRLRGALAVEVLERTLGEIVRRHEILRTSFGAEDGRPFMVVQRAEDFTLQVHDVPGATPAQRLAQAERLMADAVRRPFDLAREAARFLLYRLAPDDHILFITMHHIVTDGWSLAVLAREIETIYTAFRQDRPSPLPEPPLQYGDFAAWQRGWLHGDRLTRCVDYWAGALRGASPGTLSAGGPAAARERFAGRSLHFTLDADRVERLRALCRGTGSTLAMALHSLFAASVAWHAGVRDVIVGTSVANRRDVRLEGAIGFFANTVPVRTTLDRDATFRTLVTRARQQALHAFALEEVPMEAIVARLRRTGALTRDGVLFDTFFVLHNEPGHAMTLPDLQAELVDIHNPTTMFQLAGSVSERDRGLAYMLHYDANRVAEDTVLTLGRTFERLIGSAGAAPEDTVVDSLAEHAAPLVPPFAAGRLH